MCSPIIGTVWAATFWLVAQVATAWAWKDSQVLSGGEANERNIPQWKDTKHLRIYIVDSIPAAYTSRHSSRAGPSVGPQAPTPYSNLVNSDGSSTDEPHPFAGSKDIFFHQWMVDQLRASPLRVYEEEQADFFVIPTFLPADDTILQDRYVLNATDFLPWYKRKPHIIILSQPAQAYLRSGLLKHRESKGFTFIVHTPVKDPSLDLTHVVVAPQVSRLRWTRGLLAKKQMPFDPQEAQNQRMVLAQAGFPYGNQPSPDYRAVLRDCLERPDVCRFMKPGLEASDAQDRSAREDAIQQSWYILHPYGDLANRSAWHETIIGGSIPVVFDKRYVEMSPFTDVLDYGQMMKTLPKVDFNTSERENILDLLQQKFHKPKALHKLAYIQDVRHVFQYMRNPAHEVLRWDQRSTRRPEDDAFTFTIKAAMRNLCTRRWQPERCFDASKLG